MRYTIAFILFFSLTHAFSQEKMDVTRTRDFGRLSLNIDDFKKIAKSIEYYEKNEPKDSSNDYSKFLNQSYFLRCKIGSNNKSLSLSSLSQIANIDIGEDKFDEVSIEYSWVYKTISSVDIKLNNYSRKISISGSDERKVNALYQEISDQLSAKEVFLADVNISLIALYLGMSIFVISIMAIISSIEKIRQHQKNKRTYFQLGFSLFIITTLGIFGAIGMNKFFPGFELVTSPSNWWDRNQNLIGFISFVITIISYIYTLVKSYLKNHP